MFCNKKIYFKKSKSKITFLIKNYLRLKFLKTNYLFRFEVIIEGKDLEIEQLKEQIKYIKHSQEIQSDVNVINLIEAKKEIRELRNTVDSNKINFE